MLIVHHAATGKTTAAVTTRRRAESVHQASTGRGMRVLVAGRRESEWLEDYVFCLFKMTHMADVGYVVWV